MQILIQGLKARLKSAKRIALLGVGSELRGDDAAGILVAGQLLRTCRRPGFKAFLGYSAPENITGEIRKFAPDSLIIVDCADMGKPAGTAALIDLDDLDGVTFTTHQLPLKILADYLSGDIGCDITVIGIQPKQLKFSTLPTKEVKNALKEVVSAIKCALAGGG